MVLVRGRKQQVDSPENLRVMYLTACRMHLVIGNGHPSPKKVLVQAMQSARKQLPALTDL